MNKTLLPIGQMGATEIQEQYTYFLEQANEVRIKKWLDYHFKVDL
jgi:hypothetical protein